MAWSFATSFITKFGDASNFFTTKMLTRDKLQIEKMATHGLPNLI
jgi:hypothetical protein